MVPGGADADDAAMNSALRKIRKLCAWLDRNEAQACLRVHALLTEIASAFRHQRRRSQHKQIPDDTNEYAEHALMSIAEDFKKTLQRFQYEPRMAGFARTQTMLQQLPRVHRSLQKLLRTCDLKRRREWMQRSESELAEISRTLTLQPILADLRDGTDQEKRLAVFALMHLTSQEDNCAWIVQQGGVDLLVSLLAHGTNDQKSFAANAVGNLTIGSESNRAKLARHGVIPPLVALLSGTDAQKESAAFALANLSTHEAYNRCIVRHQGIERVIALLSGTCDQKRYAAHVLGNLAAKNDANRVEIARQGVVPLLIALVLEGSCKQKSEAAFALGNLARENTRNSAAISRNNGISALLKLLIGNDEQKTSAAKTLGIIGNVYSVSRAEMVRLGAVPLLRALLSNGTPKQQRCASVALHSIENVRMRITCAQIVCRWRTNTP